MCTHSKEERGSVVGEAAITISSLFLLLTGIYDLGMALDQQLQTSRIAYEGARYASSLSSLEPCIVNCSTLPVHRIVQDRVRALLLDSGVTPASAEIQTTFDQTSRQISISLRVPFVSILPESFVSQTAAEVRGPHLFPGDSA